MHATSCSQHETHDVCSIVATTACVNLAHVSCRLQGMPLHCCSQLAGHMPPAPHHWGCSVHTPALLLLVSVAPCLPRHTLEVVARLLLVKHRSSRAPHTCRPMVWWWRHPATTDTSQHKTEQGQGDMRDQCLHCFAASVTRCSRPLQCCQLQASVSLTAQPVPTYDIQNSQGGMRWWQHVHPHSCQHLYTKRPPPRAPHGVPAVPPQLCWLPHR